MYGSVITMLPAITPEKEEASEDLITVVVTEEFVYLDDERVQVDDLAAFLAAKMADRVTPEERAVVLDGKAEVPWEMVVAAADEIRRAGGIITMMKVEE